MIRLLSLSNVPFGRQLSGFPSGSQHWVAVELQLMDTEVLAPKHTISLVWTVSSQVPTVNQYLLKFVLIFIFKLVSLGCIIPK